MGLEVAWLQDDARQADLEYMLAAPSLSLRTPSIKYTMYNCWSILVQSCFELSISRGFLRAKLEEILGEKSHDRQAFADIANRFHVTAPTL